MSGSLTPQSVLAAIAGKLPPEGPRYAPLSFDFTAFTTWGVDFMMLQRNGSISSIQSLFIDNSTNSAAVVISTGLGQTLSVPAGYQAYLPITLSDTPKFNVTSTGTSCTMCAYNFPVFPFVWKAS